MNTEEQKETEVINVACTPAIENYYLESNSTGTISNGFEFNVKWEESPSQAHMNEDYQG